MSHSSSTHSSAKAAPVLSRPRFALLVFAGVYPLVTLLLYMIQPITTGWDVCQRTLILVPVVVLAMIWGIIPFLYRRFFAFMHPAR